MTNNREEVMGQEDFIGLIAGRLHCSAAATCNVCLDNAKAIIGMVREHDAEQKPENYSSTYGLPYPKQWWVCSTCECQFESERYARACDHAKPHKRIWKAYEDARASAISFPDAFEAAI